MNKSEVMVILPVSPYAVLCPPPVPGLQGLLPAVHHSGNHAGHLKQHEQLALKVLVMTIDALGPF